jgi:hypothetical protein
VFIPCFLRFLLKYAVFFALFYRDFRLSLAITHRRFSIINNGGGVETDPPRVSQGIMFGGVGQTTGGVQPPQPPPPAIQTLGCSLTPPWPTQRIRHVSYRGAWSRKGTRSNNFCLLAKLFLKRIKLDCILFISRNR